MVLEPWREFKKNEENQNYLFTLIEKRDEDLFKLLQLKLEKNFQNSENFISF